MFANSPYETRTMTERALNQSFIKAMGNVKFLLVTIGAVVFFTLLLVTNFIATVLRIPPSVYARGRPGVAGLRADRSTNDRRSHVMALEPIIDTVHLRRAAIEHVLPILTANGDQA